MNCAQSATGGAQDCIGSQIPPGEPFCCLAFRDGGNATNDAGNVIIIIDGSAHGADGTPIDRDVYTSDTTHGGDAGADAEASDGPQALDAAAEVDAE
jgi:hypothetical protein